MLDHIIVLWIAIVGPATDQPLMRMLKASVNPMRRIYAYWITILGLVILTALVWPGRGASLLTSPFGTPNLLVKSLGWTMVVLMTVNTVQTWLYVRKSPENRLVVHKAYGSLDFVLPTNRLERLWFIPVCLAAGICEEIIFRNFMIHYFDFLPLWGAALAASAVFGVAHLYQGWKGALWTWAFALVFTLIVAGTGSIFVAMAVHALWDLRVLLFTLPEDHELLKSETGAGEDTGSSN
ncbi:MAG TPA: type II CAAX endopeptidase family protein [Fimbriimonas sp.]|nr:type II CAAX endopeptidase family protein [Fimbriimonas sp.]